jgi:hypothetical protein
MTIRWIPDGRDYEVATVTGGYLFKVAQMHYGDWDWALFHNDELVACGMDDSEEGAKSCCVRAYREHCETLNA